MNNQRITGANKGNKGKKGKKGKKDSGRFSQDKVDPLQTRGPAEPMNVKAIREHLFKVPGDTV